MPEFIKPLPIGSLKNALDTSGKCLWGPYIRKGHKTLLAAHPKKGKTTLLTHMLAATQYGGHIAYDIEPCKVLVISEETKYLWSLRQAQLDIGDNVYVWTLADLWGENWQEICKRAAFCVQEMGFEMVVIDTFATYAGMRDENDAAEVTRTMNCLVEICTQDAAVVLLHHKRKTDGNWGIGIRGSNAMTAAVDIIIELDGKNSGRERSISMTSRFDGFSTTHLMMSADGKNYGSGREHDVLHRLLPLEKPGITINQIVEQWPNKGDAPSFTVLRSFIKGLLDTGKILCIGKGSKGSPHTYIRLP